MKRIVEVLPGEWLEFEGTVIPDQWVVSTWEKNGILERSARAAVSWQEIGPGHPPMSNDEYREHLKATYEGVYLVRRLAEHEADIEEKRLQNLKRNARRAKTMCRRIIISEGFDELLTLTYRANQTDRELSKRHFKEWYRRMKRALGDFRFCASFEVQERGAMHIHVATHKLPEHATHKGVKIPAWRLGTEVWRSVVGDNNGLCFVGAKTRHGKSRRNKLSLAKMASYVSKYIMKDYETAPDETNRYSRSNGIQIGEVHKMHLHCTFRELVDITFEQGEGDVVISHRVGYFKDSLWLCTESGKPPLLIQ